MIKMTANQKTLELTPPTCPICNHKVKQQYRFTMYCCSPKCRQDLGNKVNLSTNVPESQKTTKPEPEPEVTATDIKTIKDWVKIKLNAKHSSNDDLVNKITKHMSYLEQASLIKGYFLGRHSAVTSIRDDLKINGSLLKDIANKIAPDPSLFIPKNQPPEAHIE